jgi:hypothetical protein
MQKRPNPRAEADTADAPTGTAEDVLATLLELLRNANREVQNEPELKLKTIEAINTFRAIANDLATTRPFADPLPPFPAAVAGRHSKSA